MTEARLVSVLVPTFHRPQMLPQTIEAVLGQELPEGVELEAVICVSDPACVEDIEAANALAVDPRVRVALGSAQGPAGSRNAGLAAARGEVIAFTDDDCRPRPDWIAVSLAALAGADMVQGRTQPAGPVRQWQHSIDAVPPTWRWETSNLVVTRSLADRVGAFSTAFWKGGMPYGEDVEWGWRAIRLGARPAFAPGAVVEHAVTAKGRLDTLRYSALQGQYARIVAAVPEARRALVGGVFLGPSHPLWLLAAAGATASVALHLKRADEASKLAAAAAATAALAANARVVGMLSRGIGTRALQEAAQFAGCVYGSVRWRRLLL